MTDSVKIPIELEEGDGFETDDHFYKVTKIDGKDIEVQRAGATNRTYTPEELIRIFNFTGEISVRRNI